MAHHQVNALAGVDIKKPILTGTLYKQAHSHHLSAFNKRFFVLYPKILIYYEHENGFHKDLAKGALEHRDKGIFLEGLYLSKPDKKPHGAKYCFILHCPHPQNKRKDMLLVGESRDSRREWMEKLQEQNPKLVEDESHPHHHHHHHHHHNHGQQLMASLEVPRNRVRPDTPNPSSSDDEAQNLHVIEHSDYEDN